MKLFLALTVASLLTATTEAGRLRGTKKRRNLKRKNNKNYSSDDWSAGQDDRNRYGGTQQQGGGYQDEWWASKSTPGPRYGAYYGDTKPAGAVDYEGNPQQAGSQFRYGYNDGNLHPGLDPNGQLNKNANPVHHRGYYDGQGNYAGGGRHNHADHAPGYGGLPPCAEDGNPDCWSQVATYYPGGAPQAPPSEAAIINRAGAGYEGGTAKKTHTIDAGSGMTLNVWRVSAPGVQDKEIEVITNINNNGDEEEIIITPNDNGGEKITIDTNNNGEEDEVIFETNRGNPNLYHTGSVPSWPLGGTGEGFECAHDTDCMEGCCAKTNQILGNYRCISPDTNPSYGFKCQSQEAALNRGVGPEQVNQKPKLDNYLYMTYPYGILPPLSQQCHGDNSMCESNCCYFNFQVWYCQDESYCNN